MGALGLWLLLACAARGPVQSGKASWYGKELAGNPTASGEPFRPSRRTAAHRTLPFGTVVRVTRPDTGATVRVVINDRGPFVAGRIIDLSRRAARRIDMLEAGVVAVDVQVVGCKARYGRCGD
ncbi:septal ring lytic transglycosylase RlpA family protein [Myxococcota bacterium]|nr:septal ring lytic transglycosylase RlpA family protein [Myxococcota bacterium]